MPEHTVTSFLRDLPGMVHTSRVTGKHTLLQEGPLWQGPEGAQAQGNAFHPGNRERKLQNGFVTLITAFHILLRTALLEETVAVSTSFERVQDGVEA